MTDARRSDRHSNPDHPDRDRDARIEELLLTGLDHYFAGRHDLAINIWTRVLFLDRSHGKARAYIERARGALAEKQREAEELLQIGADALTRGDRATARELLDTCARQCADTGLQLAALAVWPAGQDLAPVLHAWRWSPSAEVREAAERVMMRERPEDPLWKARAVLAP